MKKSFFYQKKNKSKRTKTSKRSLQEVALCFTAARLDRKRLRRMELPEVTEQPKAKSGSHGGSRIESCLQG